MGSTDCELIRANRRVETLKYFVRRMSQYPPHMQLKTLNVERASARELMDEVIRIAVIDFKMLSKKLANLPACQKERAKLDYLMAKHAIESVLANKYLDKLEEMLPNIPQGRLQRVLYRREVAVWRKFKLPIRQLKTFKKLGLSVYHAMKPPFYLNGRLSE